MSNAAKATIGLMLVTMLSKVLGFTRELVLGATYGASIYSDVYITSMNIPTILFSLAGAAITTTFIPLYYDSYNLNGAESAIKYTNNTLNVLIGFGILVSILSYIFAEPLVKIFAVGFKGYQLKMAVELTKIMIFGGIAIIITNIMTVFLQVKNNFTIPGLIGIPYNLIIILSILLSSVTNIYVLAIGTLLAMISQFLFQIPFAYKKGYKYKFIFDLKDEYIKKMIFLVAPVFIGVAVNQVNVMVDRTLASTLAEGSISALNYANKLNSFVLGLFITTLGTVIYPMLSKLSSENDNNKFISIVTKSINSVILLIIPISIGAIVLAKPIVKLLFQRGVFDDRATLMTSIALVFYAIGMIAFALRDIIGKIFFSLQDTKTPMVNGTIAMIMNILLNLILVKNMGYAGLALGTSLSSMICIVLLFRSLKKKIGNFGQTKIIKTAFKSIISSIIMGIITYFSYKIIVSYLGNGFIYEAISIFISVGLGALIYTMIIINLKVEEIDDACNMIKIKLKKSNANLEIT